ncbi:unnamed protein product [Prunus brigantina]
MLKELIMNLARQGRIELDVDEITDANVATIVFGSYDPMLLPTLSPRLKFQSTRGIYQVNDLCAKELVGEPNYRGGDGFIGDSHFNDDEGWTLFYRGGVKKILGDIKPFIEAESYFTDAKFYMDEDMVSKLIVVEVHSSGKAIPRRDEHSKCLPTEENGNKQSKNTLCGQMGSSPIESQKVSIPVLRYVSLS